MAQSKKKYTFKEAVQLPKGTILYKEEGPWYAMVCKDNFGTGPFMAILDPPFEGHAFNDDEQPGHYTLAPEGEVWRWTQPEQPGKGE